MSHHKDIEDWDEYRANSRELKRIASEIEAMHPTLEFDDIKWLWDNKDKILSLRNIIDLIIFRE